MLQRFSYFFSNLNLQKQRSRGVRRKKSSENMQQIYRRTPMQKCDFNKVLKQLYLKSYFALLNSQNLRYTYLMKS